MLANYFISKNEALRKDTENFFAMLHTLIKSVLHPPRHLMYLFQYTVRLQIILQKKIQNFHNIDKIIATKVNILNQKL